MSKKAIFDLQLFGLCEASVVCWSSHAIAYFCKMDPFLGLLTDYLKASLVDFSLELLKEKC